MTLPTRDSGALLAQFILTQMARLSPELLREGENSKAAQEAVLRLVGRLPVLAALAMWHIHALRNKMPQQGTLPTIVQQDLEELFEGPGVFWTPTEEDYIRLNAYS